MRLALLALLAACGTYSMVRPARTLPPGQVEVAAGVAVSQVDASSVAHVALGIDERIEILAQNEILNSFAELRYQVARGGALDLVVGAGGGYATTLLAQLSPTGKHDTFRSAAGTASIAIGHTWGPLSLTLGNRNFFLRPGYLASSTRLGLRVRAFGPLGFLIEGGATVHAPLGNLTTAFAIGEATGGLFLAF
jgi:hypothetical protein